MSYLKLLPFALLLVACQPKVETPEQANVRIGAESAAAKRAIDSLDVEFTKHFNLGHAEVVADFYTENAHLMPPNGRIAPGREGIMVTFKALFAMTPALKLMPTEVVANGPIAVERGIYTMTMTPPGAKEAVADTGKYLVHWQLVEGKWLIVEDIWNSDLPAK